MKLRDALVFLVFTGPAAWAQPQPVHGCDSPESRQLDFWLGEWDLEYKQPDGKPGRSSNRITKIMDGCVVLEEFSGAPGVKLNGHSVSTFDRLTGRWKQTWVDNTASYLDFSGGMDQGRMIFARDAQRQGRKFKQRMVFEDVQRDRLKWLWQRSDDGGDTWVTQWEIDYKRVR